MWYGDYFIHCIKWNHDGSKLLKLEIALGGTCKRIAVEGSEELFQNSKSYLGYQNENESLTVPGASAIL